MFLILRPLFFYYLAKCSTEDGPWDGDQLELGGRKKEDEKEREG